MRKDFDEAAVAGAAPAGTTGAAGTVGTDTPAANAAVTATATAMGAAGTDAGTTAATAPAAETAAAPAVKETVITLVANRDLKWGDMVYPEGTVMGLLVLPPGVPYAHNYLTSGVEKCLIIPKPVG